MPKISKESLATEKTNQWFQLYSEQRVNNQRVRDLLWPLTVSNLEICKDKTKRSFGFNVARPNDPSTPEAKRAFERVYDFDTKPVVSTVTKGSPAEKSGVLPDDRIVGINNWVWTAETIEDFEKYAHRRLEKTQTDGHLRLTVERAGEKIKLELTPVVICKAEVTAATPQRLNASTTGRNIKVYRGLLDRMSDDDIQTILAHELAHNVMGHVGKSVQVSSTGMLVDLWLLATKRLWLGPIFGTFAGLTVSESLEREADYVSMYLLANAGFDTSNRERIWRVLNNYEDLEQSYLQTHPSSTERFLTLRKTHEEIEAKKAANEPLIPEGMKVR